jgi:predicted NAD/FAD-binding protein
LNVAVVGSGISVLGAAHLLAPAHEVTVFERGRLFAEPRVQTQAVEMSFWVSCDRCGLE